MRSESEGDGFVFGVGGGHYRGRYRTFVGGGVLEDCRRK